MKFPIEQEFKLSDFFIDKYKNKNPEFGFNGLGEFVFMRTYSRIKPNGKNEKWYETVQRVVEGIYSIQRQYIEDYKLGWNQAKAQASAQKMYDRIFNFKMIPSGRSLWAMGAPLIMEKGLTEALYSCSFLSTKDIKENPGKIFANAMDFLMCGVGVGADILGANIVEIKPQKTNKNTIIIEDSREGWVDSTEKIINSFFGGQNVEFDYSAIRAEGQPIKTFGGISAGSKPLVELHQNIQKILEKNIGKLLSATNIVDIFNLIGKSVVSGNVRRSAEVILGDPEQEFLDLKNYSVNPDRKPFGWVSNNSIYAEIGMDYSEIAKRISDNGEPGLCWLDNFQHYGRMKETEKNYKDVRVAGGNPCFSYDTKILTKKGYRKIGDLDGKTVNLIDATGNIQSGKVYKSGEKETIKLSFSTKKEIVCTPNHVFMDIHGNEIEARKTKKKKILPYLSYPELDPKYILYGYIQGDGALGRLKSPSHKGLEIFIGEKDHDILNLLKEHKHTEHKQNRIYVQDIKEELISLGFSSNVLPLRNFPTTYNDWNTKTKASFLQGCFSANGCINNKGRITYKTTSIKFAKKMIDTLTCDFGISSYLTTNKSRKVKFSNGTYRVKESYDINIASHESKSLFYNKINFYHKYKIETLHQFLIDSAPRVRDIKKGETQNVYDFSLPKLHWGVVEGVVAHNCMEIGLESSELCVTGDTRILTKNGYPKIKDVCEKPVEVWNGKKWSPVVPKKTGNNKDILRVEFSDGSHLDCTPYHKFSIHTSTYNGNPIHREVEAKDLKNGNILEFLNFDSGQVLGVKEENAFEWGFFAGDGYIDKDQINVFVYGEKIDLIKIHGMKGKLGREQIKEGYKDPAYRLCLTNTLKDLERAKELNNKNTGLPEYFFNMDVESSLNFVSGWIESDGTIQKSGNAWHYRIYGTREKMLDIQLILRRCGISGATVSLASPKGFETNFGVRNYDLYYVTIPSSQCCKIPSKIKNIPDEKISNGFSINNAHPNGKKIKTEKRQKVRSITLLSEKQDTYCFSETSEHKGVFGNVLTFQCNLVEMFPARHEDLDDFKTTIKFAYLYAKTITLLNTHWQDTNRVMLRNRRIGLSMTGIAQFVSSHNLQELKLWMEEGYQTAKEYDKMYSEWFAIPESIKITTVKPSGTLSLLAGATPGIHFPESQHYIRRVRVSKNSDFIPVLENAGYVLEPAIGQEESTVVVSFPVSLGENIRTLKDISMWEQLNLAEFAQNHWADNSVSVTITFRKEEEDQIKNALDIFQFKLKAVSFLPKLEEKAYEQMPYESITKEEYEDIKKKLKPLKFSKMFSEESLGEKYCNNDTCELGVS